MTEKSLYRLAMDISGEDPARRGMIYGPAPYWYGGREVTGWFVIGKYSVLGVPEQIKWMRASQNETEIKRMTAAARPLIPPEGVDAVGYDISPLMLRKGIRAVTGGKYSHQVIYKPAGGVPALDARLLLRNLEAMKSRTVWFYEDGVKFGKYSSSFRPAYIFELGDADCHGAIWSALLPVHTAIDGPAGFTDVETHEHLGAARLRRYSMNDIILDPCPDCGGYVNMYYDDGAPYGVKCPTCRKVWIYWPVIAISGGIDEIVKSWNASYHGFEDVEEIKY